MTNYVKSTNFATKDNLASGDPLKIVKGTEINTEYDNIAVAVATKADTASPTFTGTVTIPTLALTNDLAVTEGGTGASTAANARTNLSAASSGANSDITSITGLTTALTVAQGGTGAATLTANNVVLGNGTSAVQFVAPSTTGNLLTSNGTTWTSAAPPSSGVTSLNGQTGAVVTSSWNVIGSIASAAASITTSLKPNDTIAGSSLYYPTAFTTSTNVNSEGISSLPTTTWDNGVGTVIRTVSGGAGSPYSVPGGSVSTLTGTWRALSVVRVRDTFDSGGDTASRTYIGLFVRVS
jgi:hypothetical protein